MKDQKQSIAFGELNKKFSELRTGFKNKMTNLYQKLGENIISHSSFKGKIIFGPVPSRRLGYSLGINNIKRKICTYDCIYCQAGKTTCCSTERDCCLSPYELYFFVKKKVEELQKENIHFDYISFVPNGEPTLDNNLSKEISLIREFGYKIAVFTNSSLLWNDNVKENLMFADYVSLKIDTVNESTWEKINRPHAHLRFGAILKGISDFAKFFKGTLTTETMLIKNLNDNLEEIAEIGKYLKTLKRDASYFMIPVRPPLEKYAVAPDPEVLEKISAFVKMEIPKAEMLCCPESGDFKATGNIEEELLGIMAVHPMREEAIEDFIKRKGGSPNKIEEMVNNGLIQLVTYDGKKFYKNFTA